jgi:hypothetical protein
MTPPPVSDSVRRFYVYLGTLVVIGLAWSVDAVVSLAAGERGVWTILLGVGGVMILLGAIHRARTTDPETFEISPYALGALLLAAALVLTGTFLQLLGGI